MKRLKYIVLVAAGIIDLGECTESAPPKASLAIDPIAAKMQSLQEAKPGRFQVDTTAPKVALDTKTGMLCNTYLPDKPNDLPLCLDLFADEATVVNHALAGENAMNLGNGK